VEAVGDADWAAGADDGNGCTGESIQRWYSMPMKIPITRVPKQRMATVRHNSFPSPFIWTRT
jgi:hypothetical protein